MPTSSIWVTCSIIVVSVFWANAEAPGELAGEEEAMVSVSKKERSSWGNHPGHVNHPRETIACFLDSGVEKYSLRYSCCPHPSHAPNVATPEGYIGMPAPSSVNWYHNGFVRFIVNGKDIGEMPLCSLRQGETGERGSVQFAWEREDADVRATFLMIAGDTTLYLEVAVFPKTEFRSLRTQFIAYPVAYTQAGDRWVITPIRGIQQVRKEMLDPLTERWLLCQDHKLDRAKGEYPGGCGLQFLPAEVGKITVEVTTYPVVIEVQCKPGKDRVHFAIWDFHKKTNAEAKAYVTEHAGAVERTLTALDFSNPALKPETWTKLRAEITAMLPFAKADSKLYERMKGRVATIDTLYARLGEAAATGQLVPIDTEDKLLGELTRLNAEAWDLKFAKLFAED